jgi:hypothetical protein
LIVNGTDAPSGAPYSVASAGTFAVANTDAGMADSQKAAYKIQVACEKKEEEKNLMPPCYHETYNNPDGGTISVSGPIEMVAAYRAARGLNAVRPGMTFGRCDSLSVRMSE